MNFNITEEQQLLMESIQQFMERYAPESEVKNGMKIIMSPQRSVRPL